MLLPSPNPMTKRESNNRNNDIERKEIRSQSDQEIVFCDRYISTVRRRFETSDFSTKSPRPESMCQFMAENVNQHWSWQSQVNYQPARCAGKRCDPESVGVADRLGDNDQGFRRPQANWQEKNSRNSLHPLFHF